MTEQAPGDTESVLAPSASPTTAGPLGVLLAAMQDEFPDFRIRDKRYSVLNRSIDRVLRFITLGQQCRYLSHYHTVIGNTLYVPPSWDTLAETDKLILLRHERVHLRQRRRLTFLGMAFVYLLPFFPLGLAYGRARLEWEAYTETLRATAELKGNHAAHDPALRAAIVSRFTGPDYAWMWPFPRVVERWYDRVLSSLPHDATQTRPPQARGTGMGY